MANPFETRGGGEGAGRFRPLRKVGLETPLVGRFWGEDKRLVFAPPAWYQLLVSACFAFGVLLFVGAYFGWGWVPLAQVGAWLGPTVFLAGVWAVLSMEYAVFDLRARTYFRREGEGLFKRSRRGSLVELDAVVVLCEQYFGAAVVYRTVIHWKHAQVPLLVTEREQKALPPGAPLNHGAGPICQRAQRYARSLGVAYYDNSYFHSRAPQSAV